MSDQQDQPIHCYEPSTLEIIPYEWIQMVIATLYLLTSAASLIGNGIVIIVQTYGTESSNNIRKYLLNLAISDLFIGVLCVPFTYTNIVLGHWIFPNWLCPMGQFVQLWMVFITSFTLTIISFERYIATLHPFSMMNKWFRTHSHPLLALTWIIGAVYAYIPLEHTHTVEFKFHNITFHECRYDNGISLEKKRLYMTSNLIVTFMIPFIMLIFSYVAIVRKLLRRRQQMTTNRKRRTTSYNTVRYNGHIQLRKSLSVNTNRHKTIKMLFTIIVLYCICWMPIKVFQVLLDYSVISYCTVSQFYVLIGTYCACHWLAMANSFVNPIVYSFMSQCFRVCFDFNLDTYFILYLEFKIILILE